MAKFSVKVEIQGFRLEIEGSREDVPTITNNLGRQIAQLVVPAADPTMPSPLTALQHDANDNPQASEPAKRPRKAKRAAPSRSASSDGTTRGEAIIWRHDPAAWGNPTETWSTFDKAAWLLYVAAKARNTSEMTASQIAQSFNQMFAQSGEIRPSNVSRDFGINKAEASPKVADDATKSPTPWYLLDAGIAHVEQLITQLRASQS